MYKNTDYDAEFVHIKTGKVIRVWFDADGDPRPYSGFTDDFPFEVYWPAVLDAVSQADYSKFELVPNDADLVDIYADDYHEVDMVRVDHERSALRVGYIDNGCGAHEKRFRVHAVTLFDRFGKVVFTKVYPKSVPDDRIGLEARDCLMGNESPFIIGRRR